MSYTEAEKVFHVERMWAEGLSPAAYYARWGAPSRSTLRSWELAALRGELPAERPRVKGSCHGRPRHARYPEAARREAVRRALAGEAHGAVARSLGLRSADTVSRWVAAERGRMSPAGAEGAPRTGRAAQVAERSGKRVEELEAELAELRERCAALWELMRDPKAGDPASLSNRRKAELGERLRRELGCPLSLVLELLNVSKSTYEYNRRRLLEGDPGAEARDAADDEAAPASFGASGGTCGYRRVAADTGVPQRRVRASMRRQGLAARDSRRCKKWTSYRGEASAAPPNLLTGERGRDFSAPAPNVRWATDITEARAGARKPHLSVIADLLDGRAVAWACSGSPDAGLANSALEAAAATLAPGEAPVIHSDRGAHYRWPGRVETCGRAGLTRSMSGRGHSPDNAACEALFGRMKVEAYHGVDRALLPEGELAARLDRYARWCNSGRLKSFREPGRRTGTRYETIDGRRERLGLRV